MPRRKKSEEPKTDVFETEEIEENDFDDEEIDDYEDYEDYEDSDDSEKSKKNKDVKLEKKDIIEVVTDLKLKCIKLGVPMFISLAFKDDKGKDEYYNDCVYAAIDNPEYGKRIADLLCVMLGAETKYPDYIQDAINTLQTWQNNERTFDTGVVLSDNRFRDYIDVAEGQMNPMIINTQEEEEVIVTTTSKLKKEAEEKEKQIEKKTTKRAATKSAQKTGQKTARKKTSKKD